MIAERLTRALVRAGIPVSGVSIPDDVNRLTWVIWYKPEATSEHHDAGEALKMTYDPANDPIADAEDVDRAIDTNKALQAIVRGTFELKTNNWTLAQFAARIKAIYKTL